MSEVDVKNALANMWREGFAKGYELGRAGAHGNRLPDVEFTWNGRTPVIRINRAKVNGGLWTPN